VLGLLADLPRKNCWTIAEHAGQATPDGMQHLLARAVWDEDGVRDDLRAYVVEHFGDPAAVLVVDETGDLKKGTDTVGVQRQYTGTAGKVDNAQVAVYLAYATDAGHGVIDRELYLPVGWLADPARCHAAGVPAQRAFATKPELARVMLQRALDAGVPGGWVTADEAYGGDPRLRGWLEQRGLAYVLAVKRTELLVSDDSERVAAEQLAARVPPERWLRISAGHGAKGRRWYAWSRLLLASAGAAEGWGAGCWCAAACAPASWPTTCAPARPACRWWPWSGWRGRAGGWRRRSRPARGCAAWTSIRFAAGAPGTAG
jgi:SRSO17 transposase